MTVSEPIDRSARHTAAPQALTQSAREKLKQLVASIEKLDRDKNALADDIKATYGEAKAIGFDARVLRQVVHLRRQDRAEREEQEQIRELYLHALGDL